MINHIKQLLTITVLTMLVVGVGVTGIVNAQGNNKVTICHVPPSNPGNAHTITVSENAVDAHLAHGDYLGPCEEVEEEDNAFVELSGVVTNFDSVTRTILLEDGTLIILFMEPDFDITPGMQILVLGYEIEEGRFVAVFITTEAQIPDIAPEPRLPVWIDLTGQVSQYNAEFGTFLLDGIPVILTFAVPENLIIENGIMLTVHGELLPDGRLLADDVSEFVAPDVDAEIPTEGPVTICHIPPGNSNNAHTITVDASSVSAHLGHGDYLGACGEGASAEVITDEMTVVETTCEGACNPELIVLVDAFGVAYTELVDLQVRGHAVGEIARFCVIARLAEVEIEQIVTQYETGSSWGQILQQYPNVTPADFRANSNLGTGRE
ncbi:MAG: hypothetical protein L0154_16960 [Chloroflexi bacterium]|nr:hypothetical protein [Chloroflexota bacterium]